jgi:hypothetical protein
MNKRRKISEVRETAVGSQSQLCTSNKIGSDKKLEIKSNLKGKNKLNANKMLMRKPKKNITAYAFFIKEVKTLGYFTVSHQFPI